MMKQLPPPSNPPSSSSSDIRLSLNTAGYNGEPDTTLEGKHAHGVPVILGHTLLTNSLHYLNTLFSNVYALKQGLGFNAGCFPTKCMFDVNPTSLRSEARVPLMEVCDTSCNPRC